MSTDPSVHALYKLRLRLTQLREELGLKWREIGEMGEFEGVSFGTLNAIYHGRDPTKPEVRRKLGLPAIEYVAQVRNELGRFAKQ